ncbi:ubiquitin carboxyl-terminal hydrolase 9-like [Aristolochia californica]|uniref:ubiquitin carboxyl-terminal hydrolase 9-like n=1 Tax=Aristolochia californica TaxID=171875 RepID=UPI0035E2EB6A
MTIRGTSFLIDNEDSCLPCAPEEERRIVSELNKAAEANLKEDNVYYVLSNGWWMKWQRYVGQDEKDSSIVEQFTCSSFPSGAFSKIPCRPGPINNSEIVLNGADSEGEEPELCKPLQEGDDYVLVPQEVWKKLFEWYKGGPALPRKMICEGSSHKNYSVEVYPLCLHLIDSRKNDQSVIRISKMASVYELYNYICKQYNLDQEKVRIWDYFQKKKHTILNNFDQTLDDAQLQMDQDILLEVEKDGFWPSGFGMDSTGNELALVPIEPVRSPISIAGGPSLSNGYISTGYGPSLVQGSILSSALRDSEGKYDLLSNSSTKGDGGGLTGLVNLGNTCFMNSALQCLVHTPPLVKYFLKDYSMEINRENPLGLQGELAIAFGELLRQMWSSEKTSIAPRSFKTKLARFASQFSGYNQHDSQELLAFLLDGLHEDLNRVKKKPYIEAKDSNNLPDEEFSKECWTNHKARNDSIIVDVCQGQYKSTLVCPICNKISVTFDPFMYLSVPLPSTETRTMTITVIFSDGSMFPMPYTVTVQKHGFWKDLIQALSVACCLEIDESLLIAEVCDHKIYRYVDNPYELLSEVKDDEQFVAYRHPRKWANLRRLEIMHRSKDRLRTELQTRLVQPKFLGNPLVTFIPEGPLTPAVIQAVVKTVLNPLFCQQGSDCVHNQAKFVREDGCSSQRSTDADRMTNDGDACSSLNNDQPTSNSNMELEASSDKDFSLQLSVTDERLLDEIPLVESSFNESDQIIRVLMDWSQREHHLYEICFLKDFPVIFKPGHQMKRTRPEAISLFSCLKAFLKEEPLGPDDMWYCPSCKEHRQASKKLDLWRLPDILVFHLKRFSYSRYMKNKIDTLVNFPIHNLDLSKYMKHKEAAPESHVYELYAVINHYGGLGDGHYTAYAKLLKENKWCHFDDSYVSAASEDSIKTSAAYVLFYRRVTSDKMVEMKEQCCVASESG